MWLSVAFTVRYERITHMTRKEELRTNRKKARIIIGMGLAFLLFCLCPVLPVLASVQVAQTPLAGNAIPKYVDPLPTFTGNRVTGTNITVSMDEVQQMVLPASVYAGLPAPFNAGSYVWAYNTGGKGSLYPGFTIEAKRNVATQVTYINNLQQANGTPPILQQYLTVDQTIHWADPLMAMGSTLPYAGPVPSVAHLHGGEVPSAYDGGPDQWFTPTGMHGGDWSAYLTTGANMAVYRYPNKQPATTLWYHDHALGTTRLNVYGGLAGFYLLRDNQDTGLATNPLQLPAGAYEVEIVIQDRQFDTNGQLYFPDGSGPGLNGTPPNPTVHPYWLPEFFGDVMVVNGKSWPFLNVEPRRYRLRLLNGSNARFYRLYLGLPIWQIGTDGGLLDTPVQSNNTTPLLLAPGERADVIVDFTGMAGKIYTLRNNARAPYPGGALPDPATTGQIMQFRVGKTVTGVDASYNPATGVSLRAATPIQRLVNPATGVANVVPDVKRQLTLIEDAGPGGPLQVLLNNTKWTGKRPDGKVVTGAVPTKAGASVNASGQKYMTEVPRVGSTEQWEIINLTMDAHPIHLHLVQFQLLNRQKIMKTRYVAAYNKAFPGGTFGGVTYPRGTFIPAYGPPSLYNTLNAAGALGGNPDVTPSLMGAAVPPNPNEAGWKDTIVVLPNQVTRLMVRFAPPDIAVGTTAPGVNLYPFDPTKGPGYVWHCHILDHEDNEMMRPYRPAP